MHWIYPKFLILITEEIVELSKLENPDTIRGPPLMTFEFRVGRGFKMTPKLERYRIKIFIHSTLQFLTGPVQGQNREKPVFNTGFPGDENRFFPAGNTTQGKPCFHYRDGFAV